MVRIAGKYETVSISNQRRLYEEERLGISVAFIRNRKRGCTVTLYSQLALPSHACQAENDRAKTSIALEGDRCRLCGAESQGSTTKNICQEERTYRTSYEQLLSQPPHQRPGPENMEWSCRFGKMARLVLHRSQGVLCLEDKKLCPQWCVTH